MIKYLHHCIGSIIDCVYYCNIQSSPRPLHSLRGAEALQPSTFGTVQTPKVGRNQQEHAPSFLSNFRQSFPQSEGPMDRYQ